MNELEVIEVARDALWTLVIVSAPLMLVALGVGLLISLFQALTQVQEMTLTFVPKILAVFLSMVIFMPFMLETLTSFSKEMFTKIAHVGEYDREMEQ